MLENERNVSLEKIIERLIVVKFHLKIGLHSAWHLKL